MDTTGYGSDPSCNGGLHGRVEYASCGRNRSFHEGVRSAQPRLVTQRKSPDPRYHSTAGSSRSSDESADIKESDVVTHGTSDALGANADKSTDSEPSQIIMAIVWYGSRLGAAYYDTDSAIVHILLDALETEAFTLPKRLATELQPSVVVTSAKQDERFIQALRKLTNQNDEEESAANVGSISGASPQVTRLADSSSLAESNFCDSTLEILPSISFTYLSGKHRILSTDLPGIPSHYTDTERELYMASKIPLDCVSAIRATGGLMKYLEKHRIAVGLEDTQVKTPILDFKTFTLKDVMYIDWNTYSALQIFKRMDHPSVFKMGSGAKEGLSLFGIMDRTRSRPGRKQLQQWFNRPITDENELKRRHDAVEYFVHPKSDEITTRFQESLKHMRKLSRILKQMRTATASVSDWTGFYKTVISAVTISDFCRNVPRLPGQRPLPKIFADIGNCSTHELLTVVKLIHTIMDKEESVNQNRFVVQPGIDSELDDKKHLYNGLPSYLHKVAMQELNTYKDYISGCQIMYMRRVGYLLSLKDNQRFHADEVPGLEYKLTSEDTRYYKTEKMRELDADPGDILEEIGDQETTIMHQLQNTILEYTPALLKICQYVAELDCLISFAVVARELNYVKPEITSENVIDVKGGRHPLQECVVSLFVPNDIALGEENGRIKVVTGPNASGKSIYLKQSGLIVFLAHIGSFVPAEKARIGLINRMCSRIRTLESVSTGMSTFAIDLNQMSMAVSEGNKNSLVLVDEFGKGTATIDGVSLLANCLTHWVGKKDDCPFLICSTHFHGLVKKNLLPESPMLRYYTLDTLRDEKTDDLVFLYQLKEGVADCSYAAHIALLSGVPKEIVLRGRETTELFRKKAPVRRFDSTSTNSYLNRCSSIVEKFLRIVLVDDALLQAFVRAEVPNGMKTPKAGGKRFDSSSTVSTDEANSGETATVSDNEHPIPLKRHRRDISGSSS